MCEGVCAEDDSAAYACAPSIFPPSALFSPLYLSLAALPGAAPAHGPGNLSLLSGAARGQALRASPQRALPGSRPPRDGAGVSGRRCLRTEQRARPCSRRSCSSRGPARRASEQPPGGGGVGLAGSLHPAGIRLPPLSDSASPSAGLQQTEDFAFIFPHLLLLLEEAFAPACLLDRAWQRWDDLLEVRESE